MTKHYRHKGDAIKALSDYRVGGYLVRFTDETDPDLYGEHFNKSTDFWLERGYPVVGSRVLLEHGLDSFAKVMPIGLIEMLKEDDIGLYIEAKLNDRAEYERMLQDMKNRKAIDFTDEEISQKAMLAEKTIRAIVETGKVGWSSGALPQSVEVNEETKHIKSWAIIEGSLTFTPAEPDGTEIAPIKSALEDLSTFLTLSIPAQPAREAQPIEQHAEKNSSITISSTSADVTVSNITWLPSQIKSTIKGLPMEFLQKLLAMIQEYMAAQGGDDAMASAVVEEVKAETEEEELVKAVEDEEVAEKIAEKALQIADARLAKRQKSNSAVDRVLDARIKKLERSAEPVDPYGAGGSHNGNPRKTNHIQVSAPNRFPHWDAEDYTFALMLDKQIRAKGKEGILKSQDEHDFLREYAAKAEKAIASNRFASTKSANKAFSAIKANELGQSTLANYGDEWVPDLWDSNLWMKARIETVGLPQFRVVEMPSNPFELPIEGTDATMYYVSETSGEANLTLNDANSPIPDSRIGTGKVQLSAKKFGVRVGFSAELEEDSIIPVLSVYRQQAETGFMEGIDDVIFNGDTETGKTNINSDGSALGATSRYLALNGLRKDSFTNSANQIDAMAAAPTLALVRRLRFLMGRTVSGKLAGMRIFVNPETEGKLLGLDEFITVDKAGTAATAQTGTIGYIDRIPVLVTDQMPLTDADGKVTAAGNAVSRGTLIMAYVPHWVVGFRRRLSNSLDFLPYYDAYQLTMTARMDFKPRDTDSVAVAINLGIG
jgi:hypothetical protein